MESYAYPASSRLKSGREIGLAVQLCSLGTGEEYKSWKTIIDAKESTRGFPDPIVINGYIERAQDSFTLRSKTHPVWHNNSSWPVISASHALVYDWRNKTLFSAANLGGNMICISGSFTVVWNPNGILNWELINV